MLTEIWKSLKGIVEFGDNYEVSNLGNVKSIDRIDSNNRRRKSKILKFWTDKDGYPRVTLNLSKRKKNYGIHRLVALAFINNPESKETVNHKNGNKKDNAVSNLEWATHKEQINHADKNNLRIMPKGEDWYNSILDENKVREIFEYCKEGKYTQTELSEIYNVSKGAINAIISGKSWKHLNLGKIKSKRKSIKILTEDEKIEIRNLKSENPTLSLSNIAKMYDISPSYACRVLKE